MQKFSHYFRSYSYLVVVPILLATTSLAHAQAAPDLNLPPTPLNEAAKAPVNQESVTGAQALSKMQRPADAKPIYGAEHFTLSNGMQVIVIPLHRAPVITHMVWYRVGAADDPVGKSGIAHFLEHLMFKGTEITPPGDFSKIIRRLGGTDNAFTSQDFTAYHQTISVDHLRTVMEMEADRMINIQIPESEFISEQQVILEERRERIDNNPRAFMAEQMRYALYPNHPYGTPNIGWASEIAGLTLDDAYEMYQQYYAPNNAILVVAGDVTAAKLKPLAEKIYGVIPPKEIKPRHWRTIPPMGGDYKVEMHHASFQQPLWQRFYRVPSYRLNKEDALALQLFENIMSDGSASRLYKSIVVEQKLASSVTLGYHSDTWDQSSLSIGAIPFLETSFDVLEEAISNELRKVIKDGVTEKEITEAKTRMVDAAAFARDSISGPAMAIGSALITGSTLDDVEYWNYDIQNVTADDIKKVVTKYLNPDQNNKMPTVTGYALPLKAAPDKAANDNKEAAPVTAKPESAQPSSDATKTKTEAPVAEDPSKATISEKVPAADKAVAKDNDSKATEAKEPATGTKE
jgi:zinc protease